mmetsp:Transcript_14365/g.56522  ORF Transcript_14365/g.56522 Transcript_14365/m.56522 type:complete len:201 (+) Transcript_14365:59-661(+)
MAEHEDMDIEEEPSAPLVFQCGVCKQVVGDSWSFHSSDADVGIVCLGAVTGVACDLEKVSVCSSGKDAGSTYASLYCAECKTEVGRKYLTTSEELDNARGRYSLLVEKVCSYELGSAEIHSGEGEAANAVRNGIYSAHVADTIGQLTSNCAELQTSLLKVEKVLVYYDQRLKALENASEVEWVDVDEAPAKKRARNGGST